MSLVVIGINQTTADVAVREMLAIGENQVLHALDQLVQLEAVSEAAIVSTCNRTELYAVVSPTIHDPENLLIDFLATWHDLQRDAFENRVYWHRDAAAATHLFSVAAGLDSMILGEPDIQRQVKSALESTQAAGVAGPIINRLFQDALVAGKRARTETGIARGSTSVGAIAVERATQIFGDTLAGCTILVLGAGKMSEVTAKHLHSRGAPAVVVANRTHEKAMQLAARFGGTARRFDEIADCLIHADIVVCSTAAPHPVVTRQLIKEAMRARHNRELFLIDIAVPRDVEPAVGDLENVYLYNIDDLNHLVAGARQARAGEVSHARDLIDHCAAEFMQWMQALEVTPLVSAVRNRLAGLREAEMERLRSRLPGLSDGEIAVVAASLEALTNKIAHPAMVTIKESVRPGGNPTALATVRRAFGIEAPPAVSIARPQTSADATALRDPGLRCVGKRSGGRCPSRDAAASLREIGDA